MDTTDTEIQPRSLALDPEAAQALSEQSVLRDLDRSDHAHFLVKVPDLKATLQADVGVEIQQEDDGCVVLSLLVYDIPTEPVSYDLRFYPDEPQDLRFLWSFLHHPQIRLHPCQKRGEGWELGAPQTFRLPPNVLLRLKQYSLEWPSVQPPAPEAAAPAEEEEPESARPPFRSQDPRDTVIRKLKEQVQALRSQLQERDKRIIELEDELHEIKSRGRTYRLSSERKRWWKPF
ncbi:MAG: hypothetical protein Kow0092_22750 [Deferrisomatales bacterium]